VDGVFLGLAGARLPSHTALPVPSWAAPVVSRCRSLIGPLFQRFWGFSALVCPQVVGLAGEIHSVGGSVGVAAGVREGRGMSTPRRVVVLSASEALLATVMRLGALAGAEVEAAHSSGGARAAWRSAHLVVVGSDLLAALAAAQLPRRADVVVASARALDEASWRAAIELGARCVVSLPAEEPTLLELIGAAVDADQGTGTTIAVVGGCGGAGASTLAAALGVTAARLGSAVLIDGDPYGGGLDVLLGAEQQPGARWPDLAGTRGRLRSAALVGTLVEVDGLALLSCDRSGSVELPEAAAAAVLDAAKRGFRWVIVDLPRRFDPAAGVLAGTADLVVLVVPATVRAVAASSQVVAQAQASGGEIRIVVRFGGSGQLSAAEIAGALRLPVLAAVHNETAVAAAAERGDPPLHRPKGSLHDACRAVLAAVNEGGVAA